MVDRIDTHTADALARLGYQYRGKVRIEKVISSNADQWQEIEDATHAMFLNRALDNAEGLQLDNLGLIVGQSRPAGETDANYRTLLLVKIGKNVSEGDPERLISVFNLLTGAGLVHLQDLGGGHVMLSCDVAIPPALVDDYYAAMEDVAVGGVKVDYIVVFTPTLPFAFAGGPIPGGGFGDSTAPGVGGEWSEILPRTLPVFAFAGGSRGGGFGDVSDPLVGGYWTSL